MAVAVTIESASEPEVHALFEALNTYLLTLCPPEQCHCISFDELMDDQTTVFVARDDTGRALGVGALQRHPDDVGEVLGMYTLPELRGQGTRGDDLAVARLADRLEAMEARLLEQEQTIRHTLTMLIEWIESESGRSIAA